MANITWAMATLAHKEETFLRAMVVRALEEVGGFNPQECSNLVWAMALLTFRDDDLLAALSLRSGPRIGKLKLSSDVIVANRCSHQVIVLRIPFWDHRLNLGRYREN